MNSENPDQHSSNNWQGKTDGSAWMHKTLIFIMRFVPLFVMYFIVSVFVVPFYMIFSGAYLSTYHFYNQRLNYGTIKSFFATYLNFCQFSKNILDKFRMFAGGKFKFEVENRELYENLAANDDGFLIFSSHVGNYELAGYTLCASNKPFNALVFAGEAEMIMKNRSLLFKDNNIKMIPVADDMSHLFALNSALSNGESVSIPADRIVGNQKTLSCHFLGADAKFPSGPFALAAKRNLDVLAINVMKKSYRTYKIYVKKLDNFGDTVKIKTDNVLKSYVKNLESVVKDYPLQWFNFYDFWS